jgi:O-antigen ligase
MPADVKVRMTYSRVALGLTLALVATTFFLISPQGGKSYPGAIPWSEFSFLRRITDLMSLNGLVATARGVEIKDLALHVAAALGLLLLGLRTLLIRDDAATRPQGLVAWAQLLLAGWVLMSLASSVWAGAAEAARGQALLYGLHVAWAVALAALLDRRDLPALLHGVVVISAAAAAVCVWYYYERNPFHAPGFPIGNPNVLAAAIAPAILIALANVASAAMRGQIRDPRSLAALAALVPLGWCFWLTHARGATVALLVGAGVLGFARLGRRLRWAFATVCVFALVGGGWWWLSSSHLDVTMARGATLRFRLYAWRYAAELWQHNPWLGLGAGAYPHLAGQLADRDQALDPAAFMGELVEHAHNELFEVLAEVGLFGGVVYVAGFVATLLAAVGLLRTAPPDLGWPALGLTAGVIALFVDALGGSTLRLPGGAAMFWTLLGILWAAARNPLPSREGAGGGSRAGERALRLVPGVVFIAAALAAGWTAASNWSAVRTEQAALTALDKREFPVAHAGLLDAAAGLLDPVRAIVCRRIALEATESAAADAVRAWQTETTDHVRAAAIRAAAAAYDATRQLDAAVPALPRCDAGAARAAEWLIELHRAAQPEQALTWAQHAEQAWRRQRQRTPYDVETLLALTRYPAPIEGLVGLLRDALRFGEARGVWLRTLAQLAQAPAFDEALGRYVAAAGPITPETDLDALVASMAPETFRLAAAVCALRGDVATAAEQCKEAARLSQPLRPRFPKLYSVALAEQADYTVRAAPAEAVELYRAAVAALPVVQAQKYDELARPFRFRLAVGLLAAERVPEAVATLRLALGTQADEPQALPRALVLALREAAGLGVSADVLARAQTTLCPQFPELCGAGTQE